MNDGALVVSVAALVLTYTISIVSLVIWLTGKFRHLEGMFYQQLGKHRDEDTERFHEHADRLYKLELKVDGVTKIP